MSKDSPASATSGITTFEILRVGESGVADSWDWVGRLLQGADGFYSFELKQELFTEGGAEGPYCHTLDRFSTGRDLFEFIQEAWSEEHFEGLEREHWQEILQSLEEIDQNLMMEVNVTINSEFDNAFETPKPDSLSPSEELARRAIWEETKFGGGGAMWASIAEGLRARAAIQFYVDRYVSDHGKLPQGDHSVRVRFGSPAEGADCRPPRGASQSAVFHKLVRFPVDDKS